MKIFKVLGYVLVLLIIFLCISCSNYEESVNKTEHAEAKSEAEAIQEASPEEITEEITEKIEEENDNHGTIQDEPPLMVKDVLPFTFEEVQEIVITWVEEGVERVHSIPVEDAKSYADQLFDWLPIVDNKSFSVSDKSMQLIFKTSTGTYHYPYEYETNVMQFTTKDNRPIYFHLDEYMYSKLSLLVKAKTSYLNLKSLEAFSQLEVTVSMDDNQISRPNDYESKLLINGMEQLQWENKLKNLTPISQVNVFDHCLNQVASINEYEGGIIQTPSAVIFMSSEYKTKDGITIGSTKEQVLDKIGKPNYYTPYKWSYQRGDYTRFIIMFEDNKVRYILLTMPC